MKICSFFLEIVSDLILLQKNILFSEIQYFIAHWPTQGYIYKNYFSGVIVEIYILVIKTSNSLGGLALKWEEIVPNSAKLLI